MSEIFHTPAKNWFTYGDAERAQALKDAARAHAVAIKLNTPGGAAQDAAIAKVRDAHIAAAAIHGGK